MKINHKYLKKNFDSMAILSVFGKVMVGNMIVNMVGHKLGEFSPTRIFRNHSGDRAK